MDKRKLVQYYKELDRSLFIDGPAGSMADQDSALPIGFGQTISQPSLVLAMTQALDPDSGSSVLEIGTGSGYQTALLAKFSRVVYTIETVPQLHESAKKRLQGLGFSNIEYLCGDGSSGWPEHAPFDRIMVTAAAGTLPKTLIDQLAPGGRMIVPVGPKGMQELTLITRDKKGQVQRKVLEHVVFVEFKGKYGWD